MVAYEPNARNHARLAEIQGDAPLIMPSVDAQAVASVVADWTGIPLSRMEKRESEKLLAMEAGELDDSDMVRMTSIRSIFDDLWVSSLDHRLESVPCGVEALAKVAHYSEMLFVHRSTGTRTSPMVSCSMRYCSGPTFRWTAARCASGRPRA